VLPPRLLPAPHFRYKLAHFRPQYLRSILIYLSTLSTWRYSGHTRGLNGKVWSSQLRGRTVKVSNRLDKSRSRIQYRSRSSEDSKVGRDIWDVVWNDCLVDRSSFTSNRNGSPVRFSIFSSPLLTHDLTQSLVSKDRLKVNAVDTPSMPGRSLSVFPLGLAIVGGVVLIGLAVSTTSPFLGLILNVG